LFRSLFVALVALGASASNVLELTPENFDEHVGQGKPALVEFFAPWCGHCKNLAPVYEQLGDAYAHVKDKVVIAKVDADGEGKPLGKKYGVTGYPTLKWFDGAGVDEKYEGGRDLDSFVNFITRKTGVKSNIPGPPPSDVVQLDVHNFDEIVLDPSSNVMVTFTAPWCGHCKKLKPHYEQIATTFLPEKNCVIANIQADDQKNTAISMKYEVTGFPTIKFFSKDNKEPIDYDGDRSEEAIVKFLNEKCGANRAVGGGLNDKAGLVAELDAIAHKFSNAAADAREVIHREAISAAKAVGDAGKHYLRVMDKVFKAPEYLEKESKRLQTILAKRNLAPIKLDEIKIKANILKSFLEERKPEIVEQETIARDESEL